MSEISERQIRQYARQLGEDEDRAVEVWAESESIVRGLMPGAGSGKALKQWQRENPEKATLISRLLGEDTAARM